MQRLRHLALPTVNAHTYTRLQFVYVIRPSHRPTPTARHKGGQHNTEPLKIHTKPSNIQRPRRQLTVAKASTYRTGPIAAPSLPLIQRYSSRDAPPGRKGAQPAQTPIASSLGLRNR